MTAGRVVSVAVAALVCVVLAGCPSSPSPGAAGQGAHASHSDARGSAALVVVRVGAPRPATAAAVAFVDIAATQASREHGLMGRDRLEPDHGMLFVYPKPTPRRFWMKDCTIGLDIAFVRADGTVSAVATLPPGAGLPDDRVPVASSNGDVLYVLEMATGWFAAHGVGVGSVIDVSSAAAGVAAE